MENMNKVWWNVLQSHAILLIGKNTIPFVSWFLGLEEFWPKIRSDRAGFNFQASDSRKARFKKVLKNQVEFFTKFNRTPCIWTVKGNVKEHEIQRSSSELCNAQRNRANWVLSYLRGPFEAVVLNVLEL